jgi:hypothetical protein
MVFSRRCAAQDPSGAERIHHPAAQRNQKVTIVLERDDFVFEIVIPLQLIAGA